MRIGYRSVLRICFSVFVTELASTVTVLVKCHYRLLVPQSSPAHRDLLLVTPTKPHYWATGPPTSSALPGAVFILQFG